MLHILSNIWYVWLDFFILAFQVRCVVVSPVWIYIFLITNVLFSSVQLLSLVRLFATPWTIARQTSLSITNSRSPPKPCPSSRLCHPTISSSVVPFSSCPQSVPASGSFPVSQLSIFLYTYLPSTDFFVCSEVSTYVFCLLFKWVLHY